MPGAKSGKASWSKLKYWFQKRSSTVSVPSSEDTAKAAGSKFSKLSVTSNSGVDSTITGAGGGASAVSFFCFLVGLESVAAGDVCEAARFLWLGSQRTFLFRHASQALMMRIR